MVTIHQLHVMFQQNFRHFGQSEIIIVLQAGGHNVRHAVKLTGMAIHFESSNVKLN
jgi:hypothetical protein